MKLLVVNSGSCYSTADVYNGYANAWRAQGHTVVDYALDRRLRAAKSWLQYQARHAGPGAQKPTANDIVYFASFEAFIKALAHDVDWVVVVSCLMFHPGIFHAMRKSGLRCAVILTESPYYDELQLSWASLANVTFTNERTSVSYFQPYCPATHYLPHAYDPAKHKPEAPDEGVPAHDAVFVGTAWPERVELLRAVNWEGIDFGLYGGFGRRSKRDPLRKHVRGGITDNGLTAALYRRAAIGLNLYRQAKTLEPASERVTTAESLNPRAVELAACGCFTLSDARAEVKEVFGELVPTFETAKELEELVRYYLAHPAERLELAAQLPARVEGRTFDALGRQVIERLEGYGG